MCGIAESEIARATPTLTRLFRAGFAFAAQYTYSPVCFDRPDTHALRRPAIKDAGCVMGQCWRIIRLPRLFAPRKAAPVLRGTGTRCLCATCEARFSQSRLKGTLSERLVDDETTRTDARTCSPAPVADARGSQGN